MKEKLFVIKHSSVKTDALYEILAGHYELTEISSYDAFGLLQDVSSLPVAMLLELTDSDSDSIMLLTRIRVSAEAVGVPVIIITDKPNEELEEKVISVGAAACFPLTYNYNAVRRYINNIIQLKQSVNKYQAETENLRVSEEQFKVAAFTGDRITARYDIVTKKYYRSEQKISNQLKDNVIENVPQYFVDNEIIKKESKKDYLAFHEKIRSGKKKCTVNIEILVDKDIYRWYRCDATVIFSKSGAPSQAIIVYTDITDQREKELVYLKWQKSLRQKSPESYTLYRCNLSRNTSYDSVEGLLLPVRFNDVPTNFNDRTIDYATNWVHENDREMYISKLNSNVLLANYYRDIKIEPIEYREVLPDGLTRWIRLTIDMVEYPDSSEVQAFLMYENINKNKTEEMKAKDLADNDPLTGVLNRTAFAHRIDKIISENPTVFHAIMIVSVNEFRLINEALGYEAGDKVLIDIVKSLRSVLRHGDLLGRLNGDELIIFFDEILYDAAIEKKAKQIYSLLKKEYDNELEISVSIGIAVSPRDGEDFNSLYSSADAALYYAKCSEKEHYVFFTSEIEGSKSVIKSTMPNTELPDAKRRMLIVEDNEINQQFLIKIFENDFRIIKATDGATALLLLRRYGTGISVVLLDLIMPKIDGFSVLKQMQGSMEMRSIPVIVVSGQSESEASLQAIKCGATDYVTKPVSPDLIRLRVQSAISKAENERLRAQNGYLLLQSREEVKYRTILEVTGTVVIEYDWINSVFTYDQSISDHIAGTYDNRKLWHIFQSDMVANVMDVKSMQDLVYNTANDRACMEANMMVRLKTPSGARHWFRMNVFKRVDELQLTDKLLITYINVNEEVLSEERLRFQAERDELTGLYNRMVFFKKAQEMVLSKPPSYYVMSCFNIDHFRVVNDQHGIEKGDEVLRHVADVFREGFESSGGIICRISADNFAVLYPVHYMASESLSEIRHRAAVPDDKLPPLSFSIGRYIVDDLTLSVSAMYDRAMLAEKSVKGRYDVEFAMYNESMRSRLLREQEIHEEMNPALKSKQFEVWLQPQYNHATGSLIGAEALVRWRHPQKGIISPNDFVPVFERNGFIYELDKFVWEQICIQIRNWLDNGYGLLPISVNVSRYDVLRNDFFEIITGLIVKYDIPVELLRLEITESAFAESTERIIVMVEKLIQYGFTIEIDDFGSGYSSLNTLKDVPAQVLKLDMRFLEDGKNATRGGNILESVVRMAKWLGMSVIAEGVETDEQADYLRSIGCFYVQGYLYARPMPVAEFEKYTVSHIKELNMTRLVTVEALDNNSFWDPKSMDTLVFNSYIEGACILEYKQGEVELLRVNQKYAQELGGDSLTIEDALNLNLREHIDDENWEIVYSNIEQAVTTGKESTCEVIVTGVGEKNKKLYLRTGLRVIAHAGERFLLYCSIINITAQREAENKEREMAERLQIIIDNIKNGIMAFSIRDGNPEIVFANDQCFKKIGYTREQFANEITSVFDLIYKDDREKVIEQVRKNYEKNSTFSIIYRMVRRDGTIIWIQVSVSITTLPNVEGDVYLAILDDISANIESEKK